MFNINKYYVYEWYIVDTGEVFYVGKGSGNRLHHITGRNKFFLCMYHSHNCKVRKVYDNLTEEEAFEKEIEMIKFYRENTKYRLTNQTDGGEGTSGWKPTDEFRQKQSVIHREQWKNDDFRQAMIAIRNAENGSYKSKEFRDKISNLVRGKNNPNYNNYWSDEQKELLREKQKNNPLYKNETNPNAKKVICLETGEIFNCIKYAKEKYNIRSDGSITVALKNHARTAGGVHWVDFSEKYLDETYRRNYLIMILKNNTNNKPIICLKDLDLYNSKTVLADKLGISVSKINWQLKNKGKFEYKNKTYILLINF